MTEKELRARYKHTMFGFFWLVANPLLQMLVIGLVFTFLLKQPVKNYPAHVYPAASPASDSRPPRPGTGNASL